MNRRVLSLLCSLVACAFPGGGLTAGEFVVAGYLPEYRVDRVEPAQLSGVTDLIYFGITPPADGRLREPVIDPSRLKRLREFKAGLNCRLLICVGGWGRSDSFPALASDGAARGRFVAELLAFCRLQGFDGVDYDWEHPKSAADLRGHVALLRESRESFGEAGLMVTVAQAGWQDLGTAVYGAVDRVHLMSYDQSFPHATVEKSVADLLRLMTWGCPPGKIILGIPFYGRDASRASRTYRELVEKQDLAVEVDEVDGFAFNGRKTVGAKVELAREKGLGGVMIWELGQDDYREGRSLLEVIVKGAPKAGPAGR